MSSSIGTLYAPLWNPRARVVNATAAYTGLKIDYPEYAHFQDNKKPEFLSRFPHGKIPAFESKTGFKLFEGTAIAHYFATLAPESGLLGKSAEDQALVEQWAHLAELEVFNNTLLIWAWVNSKFGPYNKATHDILCDREIRAINTFNEHLASRTYLVGDSITLADINLACAMKWALPNTFDAVQRAKYPHVLRHFELVSNEPSLKELFGETEYVDKAIQFVPPK